MDEGNDEQSLKGSGQGECIINRFIRSMRECLYIGLQAFFIFLRDLMILKNYI